MSFAMEEHKHSSPGDIPLTATSGDRSPKNGGGDDQFGHPRGGDDDDDHSPENGGGDDTPLIEIREHSAFGQLKGWLRQLSPNSGFRLWMFLLALIVTTIVTRRVALLLIGNNSAIPAVPTEPAAELLGCTPQEDIFYFDLGGTECVCNRQWSIGAYWEKVMTGFAFNVPHVIGPFHFYCVLGRWEYIVIGIFANEVIEELILGVFARWGFLLDAAYDVESRYDSLIRDAFCCISGLWLGVKFFKIMGAKPFFQFPISYKWDVSSRHSIARLMLGFAQGVVSFQITSGYNSDRGRYAFNPANLLVWLGYALSVVLMYYCNRDFYKSDCSQRRVAFWHIGMIAVVAGFLFPMIYPQMDAMYIVLTVELSLTLILYAVDVILKLDIGGFRSWLDAGFVPPGDKLDSREDLDSFKARKDFAQYASDSYESSTTDDAGADSPPLAAVVLDSKDADNADTPPKENGRITVEDGLNGTRKHANGRHLQPSDTLVKEISFEDWQAALVECKWMSGSGIPVCSTETLLRAVAMVQEKRVEKNSEAPHISRTNWVLLAFIAIACIALLVVLFGQPWTFDGAVMYTRHWCGNPTVMEDGLRVVENACSGVNVELY